MPRDTTLTSCAERIAVEGYIKGWSRDRVVDELCGRMRLLPLEAHRLAHGWSRQTVLHGLRLLYERDGLQSPHQDSRILVRWERGLHEPLPQVRDYLASLYRTRQDRLGWGRDHSDPPRSITIDLPWARGWWSPNASGGGELILTLGSDDG